MKYKVEDVLVKGAESLTVHSYEAGIYLVEVDIAGVPGFVVDDDERFLRFNSPNAVKETFSHATVDKAWLVEETAYEEMIGLPLQGGGQLRIPMTL